MGDGCSGGMSWTWRTFLRRPPPWEGCCDTHDELYSLGGTRYLRQAADSMLYNCVRNHGYPLIAFSMWVSVRAFGGPAWPTSYRWGFATKNKEYEESDYG